MRLMASHEVPRPQERPIPEGPGGMGSQLHKYVGTSETHVPRGKEWAFNLVSRVPEKHKELVTSFIAGLSFEDRQRAAEQLAGLVGNMSDRILMSAHPEMEIGLCIDETKRWLSVNPLAKGKAAGAK